MPNLSNELVEEFCSYCIWVNEIWKVKRIIYDDNPKLDLLFSKSRFPFLLCDLGIITKDFILQAVIKIHDPAMDNRGNSNLTLDYMIQYGDWDKHTRTRLARIRAILDKLAEPLKAARNKILAHRDIQTIEVGKPLGSFGKIRSTRYFNLLQIFVNIVGEKKGKGIYPFNNAMPINDARAFLELIILDTEERRILGWPEEFASAPEELDRLRKKVYALSLKKREYEKALYDLLVSVKSKGTR